MLKSEDTAARIWNHDFFANLFLFFQERDPCILPLKLVTRAIRSSLSEEMISLCFQYRLFQHYNF